MLIEERKSLKSFNTFGIESHAKWYFAAENLEALKSILQSNRHRNLFVLGGGSNMLLTQDIDALVLHIQLKGISVIKEEDDYVIVEANAGENWHDFVLTCLKNDFGGIENLSLIPGNVGTAPIQNIGAYGVELKDVFESCTALNRETLKTEIFTKEDCKFGYRESIFKGEAKDQYIITSVRFRLSRRNHRIQTTYGAIKDVLDAKGIVNPSIEDVSDAVIAIRQSKLPDPAELGNSGSFFKNPVISHDQFLQFHGRFPEAPYFEVSKTEIKIPAGWLIEKAGFKGSRFGDAGVHKHQALVLVNYGEATGQEIWNLALRIQKVVLEKFGIEIQPEVNVF